MYNIITLYKILIPITWNITWFPIQNYLGLFLQCMQIIIWEGIPKDSITGWEIKNNIYLYSPRATGFGLGCKCPLHCPSSSLLRATSRLGLQRPDFLRRAQRCPSIPFYPLDIASLDPSSCSGERRRSYLVSTCQRSALSNAPERLAEVARTITTEYVAIAFRSRLAHCQKYIQIDIL